MVMKDAPGGSPLPSSEALIRYFLVSQIRASMLGGEVRAEAITTAAGRAHYTLTGRLRKISPRTAYRWLRAFESEGIAGLEPASRQRT